MKLRELFRYYEEDRDAPMPYVRFARFSFSRKDYVMYLKRVEAIRAALIVYEDQSGIDGVPALREPAWQMVCAACDRMRNFLRRFIGDTPELAPPSRQDGSWARALVRYQGAVSGLEPDSEENDLLRLVYRSGDDFRLLLEKQLYEELCQDEAWEGTYYKPDDLEELRDRKRVSDVCLDQEREVRPSLDLSSYAAVQTWAREEEHRENAVKDLEELSDLYGELIEEKTEENRGSL